MFLKAFFAIQKLADDFKDAALISFLKIGFLR